MRTWWAAFLVACSPVAKPQHAVQQLELVIPPMPDAGAPVVRAPPPPREPPPPSTEDAERAECRTMMLHMIKIQMAGSGMTTQQVNDTITSVLDTMDMETLCAGIEPAMRACMTAAASMNDIAACTTNGQAVPAPTIKHPRKRP